MAGIPLVHAVPQRQARARPPPANGPRAGFLSPSHLSHRRRAGATTTNGHPPRSCDGIPMSLFAILFSSARMHAGGKPRRRPFSRIAAQRVAHSPSSASQYSKYCLPPPCTVCERSLEPAARSCWHVASASERDAKIAYLLYFFASPSHARSQLARARASPSNSARCTPAATAALARARRPREPP